MRRALPALVVISTMLAMVTMRVAWSGGGAHRSGLAAAGAQDWDRAIELLSRSARWYLPGSPRVREALTTLGAIGASREAAGDIPTALAAWREVRRSIRAVRSMWLPNADLAPQADRRIAHLMAGQHEANRAGDPASFDERKREHLALLEMDKSPDPWWSLLVVLAFFGWVGGGAAFAFRAWDEEGAFQPGPALTWGGVIAGCLALWILGMTWA